MWRRDAAGNESADNASAPVTLRYDPEPPQLAFEPPPAGDPTLVAVQASDAVSRAWRTGRSRSARPDRAAGRRSPPSGRPTGCSRGSTTRSCRREPTRCGRAPSTRPATRPPPTGASTGSRCCSRCRCGRRPRCRPASSSGARSAGRSAVAASAAACAAGSPCCDRPAACASAAPAHIAGRLTDPHGNGIAGAQLQVLARTETAGEQPIGVVQHGPGRPLPLHDHGDQHAHAADSSTTVRR